MSGKFELMDSRCSFVSNIRYNLSFCTATRQFFLMVGARLLDVLFEVVLTVLLVVDTAVDRAASSVVVSSFSLVDLRLFFLGTAAGFDGVGGVVGRL